MGHGALMKRLWLLVADFVLKIAAAARPVKDAPTHILLLAIIGAIGLSLLAASPVAAQDRRQADGVATDNFMEAAARSALFVPRPAFQKGVLTIDTPNPDNEIVYIDDDGFIHVLDPAPSPDMPPLNFVSPDGDWHDAIVADVNGDGDDEIIAINTNTNVLKIYDPVVNTGVIQPDQEFNGFYWAELFALELTGQPLLLATGEFDDNPQTREIVVVFEEPERPGESRIQILAQPAPPFDGRVWEPLTDVRLRAVATDIATGDLEGDGRDNIAIVSRSSGRLSVFRREQNNVLNEFWSAASLQRPWASVAIGNVAADSPLAELVAVRTAEPPLASLVVLRYRAVNQFEDVLLRDHLPAPRQVLLANVTNADTSQIFMLRDVPTGDPRARLFNSRTGSGANLVFEARLDSDNGYRTAAAGDLDNDGKDELVVVRDTGLLIFDEPSISVTQVQTFTTPTNRRTLALGNLDALGRDLLASTPTQINFSVPAGQQSAPQSIILSNRTRPARSLPFAVSVAPSAPPLVDVAPTSAATTASIIVTADATDLLPISELSAEERRALPVVQDEAVAGYGANLIFAAMDPLVLNSPLTVPVFIEVTPGIVMRPASVNIVLATSEASPDCRASLPQTVEVRVLGTPNSTFTASTTAEWLSVEASQHEITPTATAVLTLTVSAETTPSPIAMADVVVNAEVPVGTQRVPMIRRVTVKVACFQHLLYLPIIRH